MKHFDRRHLIIPAHTILLILIGFLIAPSYLLAQDKSPADNPDNQTPYELVRLDWEEKIPSGFTLVLDNRWGDIHLRQTGAAAATFHAVMQKIGTQPKIGELLVEKSDQRITLRVSYPEDQQPETVKEGRVDVALLVPYGINIEILADFGKVSSKTLESPVKITATNQPVSLKSASSVNIESHAGAVDIQFVPRTEADTDTDNDRGRVKTILGDINIRYYPGMQMGFEMLSGRPKTTNDLELLRNRELTGRQVNMHTGENPDKLYLQSDTGYIRLINTGSEILLSSPD